MATSITNQPVKAGFPNAAQDAPQHSLDLHSLLVKSPASTFFMRVEGVQLEDMGIYSGDLVIIDKSAPMRSGSVVVAYVEGQFIVRQYKKHATGHFLVTTHATKQPMITINDDVHIWGVVTHTIHSHDV